MKKKSIRRKKSKKHIQKAVKKKKMLGRDLNNFLLIFFVVVVFLVFVILFLFMKHPGSIGILDKALPDYLFSPPGASTVLSGSGEVELSIYDSTDLAENRFSGIPITFFANYTEVIGSSISDVDGSCTAVYDLSLQGGPIVGPESIVYDSLTFIREADKTFNYKGTHRYEVVCSTTLFSVGDGDVTVNNSFVISNSEPDLFETPGGFVDIDGNPLNTDVLNCIEDETCTYNISSNVSDPDFNDLLDYDFVAGDNTTLTSFNIDALSGLLTIDIVTNSETGNRVLELDVRDSDSARDTGILNVEIAPVNDPPYFVNLANMTFNRSIQFDYLISTADEEDNVPYSYSIDFLSCVLAPWSTRTNCELFTVGDYVIDDGVLDGSLGFINISFTPARNDVGLYVINFTIFDSGIPDIASQSKIVEFDVINPNEAPFFINVCDGINETTENVDFSCYVNASDIDETSSLTFDSNFSWFIDNVVVPIGVSDFNASVFVNILTNDAIVGNWSVKINVTDSGSPVLSNSTEFYFFIDNVDDQVYLDVIPDIDAYTSNSYSILINATDDDVLIPDKSVYDEVLLFSSDAPWVTVVSNGVLTGTNITQALIQFDGADVPVLGINPVTITVTDSSGLFDMSTFNVNSISNNRPIWLPGTITDYVLTEDLNFNTDFSDDVSDPDFTDILTFTYLRFNSFPSFSVNPIGLVDFTPIDEDVGEHILEINVSDGIFSERLIFNFTVYNVNDAPFIINSDVVGNNIVINPVSLDMNTFEDDEVDIFFFVNDDDLRVPNEQSNFFEEKFSVSTLINGPNTGLLSFSEDVLFPPNELLFETSFTPVKADIGFYEVLVNFTDDAGESVSRQFNLTINEINHPPVLTNIDNKTAVVNYGFSYDINATDLEDGDDFLGALKFDLELLPDGKTDDFVNGNESVFNTTTGLLNYIFNLTEIGSYHINITVFDSEGLESSGDFWLNVNSFPSIQSPNEGFLFNLTEGVMKNITFNANLTVNRNLKFEIFINNQSRESFTSDNSTYIWGFTPSFNDETYGVYGDLTLIVSIPGFDFANDSRTWKTNISHANAPIQFIKNIGDKEGVYGNPILINLTEYFRDIDYLDQRYNQTLNFTKESNVNVSNIGFSVSEDLILSLKASSAVVEILNLTGSDFITNATSNNFEIRFTEPLVIETPTPTPSSGGGGGGSSGSTKKPVPLQIIVPGPISAKKGDVISLPIELTNDGTITLRNIDISSLLAIEGIIADESLVTFDRYFIDVLQPGATETVIMTINLIENKLGLFEITIEATVLNPNFMDTSKIYINVQEGETIEERIIFTEEFIADNPECIELTELIKEAKEYSENGEVDLAKDKLQEALDACKETISQRSIFSTARLKSKIQDKVFVYVLISTILAITAGIGYYVYRRITFNKVMKESLKAEESLRKF